jgi:hypothetical protein
MKGFDKMSRIVKRVLSIMLLSLLTLSSCTGQPVGTTESVTGSESAAPTDSQSETVGTGSVTEPVAVTEPGTTTEPGTVTEPVTATDPAPGSTTIAPDTNTGEVMQTTKTPETTTTKAPESTTTKATETTTNRPEQTTAPVTVEKPAVTEPLAPASDRVYVKDGGNGNGSTASSAFGSLDKAFAALPNGGSIIVCGKLTLGSLYEEPAHSRQVTITSSANGEDFRTSGAELVMSAGKYLLSGTTVFDNINLNLSGESIFAGRYFGLTMGDGVKMNGTFDAYALGGLYAGNEGGTKVTEFDYNKDAKISVFGGKYSYVCGGDMQGTLVKILGGTTRLSFGGNAEAAKVVGGTYGGLGGVVNTELRISGGKITELLAGGNANGNYAIGETKIILEKGFSLSGSFSLGKTKNGIMVNGITGNGILGSTAATQLTRAFYYDSSYDVTALSDLFEAGGFDKIEAFTGTYKDAVKEYKTVKQTPPSVSNTISAIANINQLNQTDDGINSHAADALDAMLEKNFRESVSLPSSVTGTDSAFYVRVKKTLSGGYIAIYQDSMFASSGHVYCSLSDDMKTWSKPQIILQSKNIFGGVSVRRYHTADAIVLQNGDILVAACYQASGTKGAAQDTKGLVVIRSNDGGHTWSDEQVVYYARNWEPSFLQLPSGEVQLYYTSSASYFALYPNQQLPMTNSGTSLLRSFDNGYTFTPFITTTPYEGHRIINIPGKFIDGKQYYTGQMPVAILLNGTNEIAVAIEMQDGTDAVTSTSNGIAFNSDNWAKPLALDEAGPEHIPNINPRASAPYIRQFPSGEVVYSGGADLSLKIGDAKARNYQTAGYKPFSDIGYAGSLELIGSHTMLAVLGTAEYKQANKAADVSNNTIELAPMYLNHRIAAKNATIKVDGNNSDWKDNTDAIFVGSDSQAQETLRYANDGVNIYIIAERLDSTLTALDTTDIYFTVTNTPDLNGSYKISVGQNGIISTEMYAYGSYSAVQIAGIEAAVYVNNSGNTLERGYNVEIKIPKASVGLTANLFRTCFVLNNSDDGTTVVSDKLFNAKTSSADNWIKVDVK